MNRIINIALITTLIFSILLNLFLFFALGVAVIDFENQQEMNDLEWCEFANDYIDYINSLTETLTYYDPAYEEFEPLTELNCWGYEYE